MKTEVLRIIMKEETYKEIKKIGETKRIGMSTLIRNKIEDYIKEERDYIGIIRENDYRIEEWEEKIYNLRVGIELIYNLHEKVRKLELEKEYRNKKRTIKRNLIRGVIAEIITNEKMVIK